MSGEARSRAVADKNFMIAMVVTVVAMSVYWVALERPRFSTQKSSGCKGGTERVQGRLISKARLELRVEAGPAPADGVT